MTTPTPTNGASRPSDSTRERHVAGTLSTAIPAALAAHLREVSERAGNLADMLGLVARQLEDESGVKGSLYVAAREAADIAEATDSVVLGRVCAGEEQ